MEWWFYGDEQFSNEMRKTEEEREREREKERERERGEREATKQRSEFDERDGLRRAETRARTDDGVATATAPE